MLVKISAHFLKDATLSLTHLQMEDSPGPALEPELVPSDLSSDWPTGMEGGMVKHVTTREEGRKRES